MDRNEIPYDSPIDLYSMTKKMVNNVNDAMTDHIWKCVLQVGVNVDKEKLIQAIHQDRKRYEEAYQKGYLKSQEEFEAFKRKTNHIINGIMNSKKCFPMEVENNLFPDRPFECSQCMHSISKTDIYCSQCGSEIIWPIDSEGENENV